METGKRRTVLAVEICSLLPLLHYWSLEGLQRFIESGTLSDIIQAARSNKVGLVDFEKWGILGTAPESPTGSVTMTQLKRLIEVAPLGQARHWGSFVHFFRGWSYTAPWWGCHCVSWELRDDWRVEMGLERINPSLRSEGDHPIEIIFKKIGKEKVWEKPPEGYRYATLGEVGRTRVPRGYEQSTLVNDAHKWFSTDGLRHLPVCSKYVSGCFADGNARCDATSFGYQDVLVALVKI